MLKMRKLIGLACHALTFLILSATTTTAEFSVGLEWSWQSSTSIPTALNVTNTPSIIDLNKDGIPDVVFSSTASTNGGTVETGYLRALSGRDGTEIFTVTNNSYRVNSTSSMATGDIDGDGFPEIIACDNSGVRLIVFEHDGSFKWRSKYLDLDAINWGAPAIADINQDGDSEIIIGRQVLDNEGNLIWTGTGGQGSQEGLGALSLVSDIDLDGSPDIVAGNTVYDNAGNIKAQTTIADGYPAVGNFDDDDYAEIVLVSDGSVYLLEHDGTTKWGPVSIPGGGNGGPPTVADYDNDGEPEIGVAGATRYAVFETDGSLKWAAVVQDNSSNRNGSTVFDFENDGSAEVVYSDETSLWVLKATDGSVLFQTPLSSCTWVEYPLVADVDGDNQAEIVAVANNNCGYGAQRGVYVYGSPNKDWALTRPIWNQYTYHITNINSDGTIPPVEENNWQVSGLNNFRVNIVAQNEVPVCDINQDGSIDLDDILGIRRSLRESAAPGDARDADGDGKITVNDARKCVLKCTNQHCKR